MKISREIDRHRVMKYHRRQKIHLAKCGWHPPSRRRKARQRMAEVRRARLIGSAAARPEAASLSCHPLKYNM